jgi:hypothetical protein
MDLFINCSQSPKCVEKKKGDKSYPPYERTIKNNTILFKKIFNGYSMLKTMPCANGRLFP